MQHIPIKIKMELQKLLKTFEKYAASAKPLKTDISFIDVNPISINFKAWLILNSVR